VSAEAMTEQRLSALDIALPPPPTPFGAYVEAVKIGNLLFLSGMLPVVGHEPKYVGRVGGALSAEDGRKAAGDGLPERPIRGAGVSRQARQDNRPWRSSAFYIATEGDFRDHPKVADGASELLVKVFALGCFRAVSSSASPACPSACRLRSNSSSKSRP